MEENDITSAGFDGFLTAASISQNAFAYYAPDAGGVATGQGRPGGKGRRKKRRRRERLRGERGRGADGGSVGPRRSRIKKRTRSLIISANA